MISKHSKQTPALTCPLSSPQLHTKPPSWGICAISAVGLVHPHQPHPPGIQAEKELDGSMVTSQTYGQKYTSVEAGRVRRVRCPPPTAIFRFGWAHTWTKEWNKSQAHPGSRVDPWPKLDGGFKNTYQEQGGMKLCGPGSDNQTQRVTPESWATVITWFTKPPF